MSGFRRLSRQNNIHIYSYHIPLKFGNGNFFETCEGSFICPFAQNNASRMGDQSPSNGWPDEVVNIFNDLFPMRPSVCLALIRTNVIVPSYAILISILSCSSFAN